MIVLASTLSCNGSPRVVRLARSTESLDGSPIPALNGLSETALGSVDSSTMFGAAVAIKSAHAVVGAADAVIGSRQTGAVFQFTQGESGWQAASPLVPMDKTVTSFGSAVSVSTSIIAATGVTSAQLGNVWLWNISPSTGELEAGAQIAPPAAAAGDQSLFGFALVSDATTLIVASPATDGGTPDTASEGAVFVYNLSQLDAPAQTLVPAAASLPTGALSNSYFGYAVALDGDNLVIGAPGESDGVGAAYVFQRSSGSWQQTQRVIATATSSGFGSAVAIRGSWLASAAPDLAPSGAVSVFQLSGSTWGSEHVLVDRPGSSQNRFGCSIGFTGDQLLVGGADSGAINGTQGRVQVFSLDGTWTLEGALYSSAQSTLEFSASLAIDDRAVVVGAQQNAFVFQSQLAGKCDSSSDCASSHCVAGLCCNSECTDACYSCSNDSQAPGMQESGLCLPVAAGLDPRDDCAVSAAPCGQTGVCDGSGACAFADTSTGCGSAGCSADSRGVHGTSHCDGTGACADSTVDACTKGYLCGSSGLCSTTCQQASDCDAQAGYYCKEGACVIGASCSADRTQMYDASGHPSDCIQSLCSDGACHSTCASGDDCRSQQDCRQGVCIDVCSADVPCSVAGFYCSQDGVCVTGARCSADNTTAYGPTGDPVVCLSALCVDGQCGTACTRKSDCVGGLACDDDTHQCVEQPLRAASVSGGCGIQPLTRNNSGLPWLVAAVFGFCGVRRRSQKSRRRSIKC